MVKEWVDKFNERFSLQRKKCIKEVCLPDMSWNEALNKVKTAFNVYQRNAKRVLNESNLTFSQVCIVGSFARRGFGFSNIEDAVLKVKKKAEVYQISPVSIEEVAEKSRDTCEFFYNLKDKFQDIRNSRFFFLDIKPKLCSDVDITTFVEEGAREISNKQFKYVNGKLWDKAAFPAKKRLPRFIDLDSMLMPIRGKGRPALCSIGEIQEIKRGVR